MAVVSNTKVFKGILEIKTFKQIKFWKKEIDLRQKLQKYVFFFWIEIPSEILNYIYV